MNDRIFVKPAKPELKVRKPVGGHLLAEGEAQNDDSYWRRRELDGDVLITAVATAAELADTPASDTGAPGAAGAASKKR